MTPSEYIKHAIYDDAGQMIFAKDGENLQQLVDVRGWGHIQHMFSNQQDAMNFQDSIGQFVTDAINEKIQRELKSLPETTTK